MVAPLGVRSIAMIRACLLSARPVCWGDDRGRRPAADCVVGLSFAALCAVWVLLLRPTVFLPSECDVVLRFDFAMDIGISFGFAASSAATTEAPPRPSSRRGRIPERAYRSELATLPLCWLRKASPFWIILLLVLAASEHVEPHLNSGAGDLAREAFGMGAGQNSIKGLIGHLTAIRDAIAKWSNPTKLPLALPSSGF